MIAIRSVETGSLGERAGLCSGDHILRINEEEIGDLIDFQVHSSDPLLHIVVERASELYDLRVERIAGETMGLAFEEMPLRRCDNKCVFCFLHQMPSGMRRSLYFEDDDYRLSFIHGSYVTLTNVTEKHIDRIIRQRLSPQYISVHATDPELRQAMLGRKRPTVPILDRIEKLATNGIQMHAQVVVCPGLNDGLQLCRTLHELSVYYPLVKSVALAPVGLTRFRAHLPDLRPVTRELAAEYLDQCRIWGEAFSSELGERFVYPADELFLLVNQDIPPAEHYDTFPQIENGVGMVRRFLDSWEQNKGRLAGGPPRPLHLALVTGTLASAFIEPIATELNTLPSLRADVVTVGNDFFGRGITVSGLLTGVDIAAQLRGGPWDIALLPPNCINGDGLTLDDLTVADLEAECGVPLTVGDYNLASALSSYFADPRAAVAGKGRQLSEMGFTTGRGNG